MAKRTRIIKRLVVVAVLTFLSSACSKDGEQAAIPKPGDVVHGFTQRFANVGDDPLCVGQSEHDLHAVCGGVEYPGRAPGCGFGFKQQGGQKIVVRYKTSQGFAEWQPITLDGRRPSC